MRPELAVLASIAGLLPSAALAEGPPAKAGHAYRVVVDSDLEVVATREGSPPTTLTLHAGGEFDYRVEPGPGGVVVSIDRMGISSVVNGKPGDTAEMNRDLFETKRPGGRSIRSTRDDAPPPTLAILDQFGAPLASCTLDAEGGEVAREMKVRSGVLVDTHAIETTRIFHPRFARDRESWEAPAVFPLGRGQLAAGTLRYTKRPGGPAGGPVVVAVEGDLKATGSLGTFDLKRSDYKVAGEQTYDPATAAWTSGRLVVGLDFEGVDKSGGVARGKGPCTLTLSTLPEKPAGR